MAKIRNAKLLSKRGLCHLTLLPRFVNVLNFTIASQHQRVAIVLPLI
jgi:hypothetical protein